jgi:hypothetical protein
MARGRGPVSSASCSLAKSAVLDTSYCRQEDSRSSVARVNAAVLALDLYF